MNWYKKAKYKKDRWVKKANGQCEQCTKLELAQTLDEFSEVTSDYYSPQEAFDMWNLHNNAAKEILNKHGYKLTRFYFDWDLSEDWDLAGPENSGVFRFEAITKDNNTIKGEVTCYPGKGGYDNSLTLDNFKILQ